MRSGKTSFAILDTSVYIENFKTDRFTRQILASAFIPRCSAVVLHELLRGARTSIEKKSVHELQRRCRVVTREHHDVAKMRELAFDVLIALSARSIGATLVTCNEADFRAIGRHLSFDAADWT